MYLYSLQIKWDSEKYSYVYVYFNLYIQEYSASRHCYFAPGEADPQTSITQ
jgi:hypothetical protein